MLDNTARTKTTFLEGSGRFIGDPPTGALNPAADAAADGVTLNLVNVPAPQAAKAGVDALKGGAREFDIVAYGQKAAGFDNHDAVLDVWATKNIPGYSSRTASSPSIRLSEDAHSATKGVYRDWLMEKTGRPVGGRGDWSTVGPREVQSLTEKCSTPRGSIVGADNARNTITRSGGGVDIANIMEAISIFDVDVMKGMSFALVPVRTSQPGAIADELRTIFASDREGPMAGMVQFLPNKRLGAILIVSAQPKYLSCAETWVRRLDAQAEGSEKQFFTYAVQNRRAQELVDVLQSMFSTEIGGRRSAAPARTVAPQYREASVQSRSPTGSAGSTWARHHGHRHVGHGDVGRLRAAAPAASQESSSAAQIGRDEATGEPRVKIAAPLGRGRDAVVAARAHRCITLRRGSRIVHP